MSSGIEWSPVVHPSISYRGLGGLEAYTQVSSHVRYVENKHPDSNQMQHTECALFTYWNKASTAELMDFTISGEWFCLCSLTVDFLAN